MSTDDKNRAIAAAILPLVGGAENIDSVAHRMTRLRLGLRDRSIKPPSSSSSARSRTSWSRSSA